MQQHVSSGAVCGVSAVVCCVKPPSCGGEGGECEGCMQVSLSLSHTQGQVTRTGQIAIAVGIRLPGPLAPYVDRSWRARDEGADSRALQRA